MKFTPDTVRLMDAINKSVKAKICLSEPTETLAIPTGSFFIDQVFGVGGIPIGGFVEIFGGESGGKSTIALSICAMAQKQNIVPFYIDMECALDFEYAQNVGLDMGKIVLAQPSDAEESITAIEAAVNNGCKLIVIDSVPAMIPHRETEEESEIGDNQIGLHARVMAKMVRRLTPMLKKHQATIICINQRRAKIGAMPGTSTEDTPGGFTLKHAYIVRMKVTRISKESGDNPDFITSKIEIVKNKVAPPYRKCDIKILFGRGIDIWGELVDLGVEYKILKKSGAWYKLSDENIGQGELNTITYLQSNMPVVRKIIDALDFVIDKEFYKKYLMEKISESA